MRDPHHFLFYASQASASELYFDAEETQHIASVLRCSAGNTLFATDGCGILYTGVFKGATKSGSSADVVTSQRIAELKPSLTMYVGLPQKDAFESVLAQVCPLGLIAIVPLVCDASQKSWWDGWEKQIKRFETIAKTATMQSLQTVLPKLCAPVLVDNCDISEGLVCLLGDADGVSINHEKERCLRASKIALCIGPPGGFSQREKAFFLDKNAAMVRFSTTRLRTETAASALCAIVNAWRC